MGNLEAGPVRLEQNIWSIRGRRVMLDWDLAELYGVSTKRLNEQVRRNRSRFPVDFMFQLTPAEFTTIAALRSQFATLKQGQHRKFRPHVFTEHGALMLASVLNSERAVEASIEVVRAFVRLRALLSQKGVFARDLKRIKSRLHAHDDELRRVWESIESLEEPEARPQPKIGFQP
ncbi:MAG: ORF6N domain-containing protein [Elusimicrobia bacterium]|nr:ORF6N domain-containing protein [Elusimicrobiota bacterium]